MKKSFIIISISIIIALTVVVSSILTNNNSKITWKYQEKKLPNLENTKVPYVTFKTRLPLTDNEKCSDDELFDITSKEIFKNKKIVILALPGAYTPICSSRHLPDFEKNYENFKKLGIDEVYVLSVNDPFVMANWLKDSKIKKVKMLPDGNGDFTKKLGMLVEKQNIGFGKRSWRYSMYVEDGIIKKVFPEKGFSDNTKEDPFEASDAKTILNYLTKILKKN